MSYSEYIVNMFVLNEDREQLPKPLTDLAMKEQILREFGHNDRTLQSFMDGHTSIGKLRIDFNRGSILASNWPPENPGHPRRLSLRYSGNGEPIFGNNRKSPRVLTNRELCALLEKYDKVQETPADLFRRLERKGTNPDSTE